MVLQMVIYRGFATADDVCYGLSRHAACEVSLLDFCSLGVRADDALAVGAHVILSHVIAEVPVSSAFPPTHVLVQHLGYDGSRSQSFFQSVPIAMLAESARLTCDPPAHRV